MLDDELRQLSRHLRVCAESQLGLDSLFQRADPQIRQTRDLSLGERLIGEIGQGLPPPQSEGLPQERYGLIRLPRGNGPSPLINKALEPLRVDRFGIDREEIARRAPQQEAAWIALAAPRFERITEVLNVALCSVGCAVRRRRAPEDLKQPVSGHDLVRANQQGGQQRTGLRAT
jgi:hypothetical protein